MVISLSSGLWINIDDITIGNRNPIGIKKINENIPSNFNLGQNYPNPFNPQTKIKFDLPKSNLTLSETKGLNVTLVIYDILGREVFRPVNGNLPPGTYEYSFNAAQLSSGIYYYPLIYGNYSEQKR